MDNRSPPTAHGFFHAKTLLCSYSFAEVLMNMNKAFYLKGFLSATSWHFPWEAQCCLFFYCIRGGKIISAMAVSLLLEMQIIVITL